MSYLSMWLLCGIIGAGIIGYENYRNHGYLAVCLPEILAVFACIVFGPIILMLVIGEYWSSFGLDDFFTKTLFIIGDKDDD